MVIAMHPVTSTRLESLSNELLLDIFEYLNAYDMYQALYGLNSRLNSLLRLAQLHILHNPSTVNKAIWNTLTSFYNSSQIRILSFSNNIQIDERILAAPMENLRTVRFRTIALESVDKICEHFPIDNQIESLSGSERAQWNYVNGRSIMDSLLVHHGHRFLSLVHLSLACNWNNNFPLISVTFPQLRYLSLINFTLSTDLFQFLQNKTPNLRSLRFEGRFNLFAPSSFIMKHVHELHTNNYDSISSLQGVVSNFPSLRRLHIALTHQRQVNALNGSVCQQLIEQYFPHLKQFTMDFNPGANEDILQTFYKGEFWSTKKIKVKTLINKLQSRYPLVKTIYFGNEWHSRDFDNLNFE